MIAVVLLGAIVLVAMTIAGARRYHAIIMTLAIAMAAPHLAHVVLLMSMDLLVPATLKMATMRVDRRPVVVMRLIRT
jgi:hypothetical protein